MKSGSPTRWNYASEAALVLLLSWDPPHDIQRLRSGTLSALSIAARVQNDELIHKLLELGADVDSLDTFESQTWTPLQVMCYYGRGVALVNLALQRTQKLHAQTLGENGPWSLLHLATNYFADKSDPNVLRALVAAGIRVDTPGGKSSLTPLELAIVADSVEDAKVLLELGASPSQPQNNCYPWCPLVLACSRGSHQVAQCLMDLGATWDFAEFSDHNDDVYETLFGNMTFLSGPLEFASSSGQHEIVKQVLQWKEDGVENLECPKGASPLFWSSWTGDEQSVRLLLDKGYDIHCREPLEGLTCLHAAAANGHASTVRLLLDSGCNVHATDRMQRTARIHALEQGYKTVINLLDSYSYSSRESDFGTISSPHVGSKHTSSPRKFNSRYLASVIEKGDLKTLRRLQESGEDLSRPFSCGSCTPILLALYFQQAKICTFLIEQGIVIAGEMCAAHGVKGTNVYHLAPAFPETLDVLQKLVDTTYGSATLQTELACMLRIAAAYGNNGALQRLANADKSLNLRNLDRVGPLPRRLADPSATRISGNPLWFAVLNGQEDSVVFLLNAGAQVDQPGNQLETALHVAVKQGYTDLVHILLEHDANPNALDCSWRSPLHSAAQYGRNKILNVLLRGGCDPWLRDIHDFSALTLAARMGHMSIVQTLLSYGQTIDESRHSSDIRSFLKRPPWAGFSFALNMGLHLEARNYLFAQEINEAFTLVPLIKRLSVDQLLRNLMYDDDTWTVGVSLTPLHHAIALGKESVATILLQAGALINQESGTFGTPLMYSCWSGRMRLVQVLIRMGAIISYRKGKETISAIRAAKNFPKIVRWILVERFTDQRKIHGSMSVQTSTCPGITIESVPQRSYAPAPLPGDVPWDTKQFIARNDVNGYVRRKLREMRLGLFMCREDGHIELVKRRSYEVLRLKPEKDILYCSCQEGLLPEVLPKSLN